MLNDSEGRCYANEGHIITVLGTPELTITFGRLLGNKMRADI